MPVRSTMTDLITRVSLMIADPTNAQFPQQTVQDYLDAYRDDIRYEPLIIAPSIVNLASTSNAASTIFADYYSKYQWWEADVVIQGQGPTGLPWIVLTPLASDYIVGHWQFDSTTPFVNGTVPGQLPPLFATGKVYDLNAAAADLLEFWAATLTASYDVTVDGQSFKRSQMMQAKLMLAAQYRRKAKPRVMKMVRSDVAAPISAHRTHLLDVEDNVKGV